MFRPYVLEASLFMSIIEILYKTRGSIEHSSERSATLRKGYTVQMPWPWFSHLIS